MQWCFEALTLARAELAVRPCPLAFTFASTDQYDSSVGTTAQVHCITPAGRGPRLAEKPATTMKEMVGGIVKAMK